ncbi:MAG: ABC transporter ATP-binding protein [Candidatus Izemoplasmataceae bacterium]
MATLELKQFTAYYKLKKDAYLAAIDNINFTVEDGSFVVVIGPSGCGKTTLLRAIAGFMQRIEGSLYVENILFDNIPSQHRNFGYVSQTFDLYKTKTIYENIAFPLRMMKIAPFEIRHRVEEVSSKLGISVLLSRKPRQLSIGQQQKVAIARALIKNPRVLLFDEPFSNLDVIKRKEMRKYLKEIHEAYSITTVFVTHQKEDAIFLADKIAIMQHGSIIYYGLKEDLLLNENKASYRKYLYGE